MSEGRRERKPPGLEIAAGAKVRELRFEEVPETETRFRGDTEETSSESARENLPSRVREGETYRQAGIRWRAAASVGREPYAVGDPPEEAAEEPEEDGKA